MESDYSRLANSIMSPDRPKYVNPCVGCGVHVQYGCLCETCLELIEAVRAAGNTLADVIPHP